MCITAAFGSIANMESARAISPTFLPAISNTATLGIIIINPSVISREVRAAATPVKEKVFFAFLCNLHHNINTYVIKYSDNNAGLIKINQECDNNYSIDVAFSLIKEQKL